ncbi:P22AR C-terminal domain-containing protein [Actinobacillus pleuropneumoniae]|uniref:P22AR C-terminal domain-containing protein n=1 Tax=Actinobacillus pleuropneumoniae TaxID=715 RepID=UPI0022779A37|nr:P22AR C-terminal domain-containing protein [Actinobacillus pleuropneumoniae]MCY6396691.1 KilA-N domain-containing protein [Actinobacillus pleuropneumoniae]MCY6410491.1 KilA-N domain-containing protein [Actinobacillus pleuropneumoniae]
MSNLQILSTSIRQLDNLFNLKDLHIVAGNEKKHEPYLFVRLDTTKELIEEIKKEDPTTQPLKTLRGPQGGTYACEELALAYAMWISPKFHLVVLRAFLAMHKQQNQQQPLALPEPEKKYTFEFTEKTCLRFVSMWFALYNNLELLGQLHQPLSNIGSHFGSTAYTHYTEYQTTLGVMKSVLEPMTKDFNPDPYQEAHYYKALKTLRDYQLKGLARIVKHPTPPTRKYEL